MKILVDLQSCQSGSRCRGIGRYSMSLLKAMLKNPRRHEYWVLLNGQLPETIENIQNELAGFLQKERIVFFSAPGPVAEINRENLSRARQAELIREAVIAQIDPDVVHITSMFEGFSDNVTTSIGTIGQRPLIAVTAYDFIPYLNQAHFFSYVDYKEFYLRKIQSLKKVDVFLSISSSSAQEVKKIFEVNDQKVITIGSAVDRAYFSPGVKGENPSFGIMAPYLLCVGNVEPHKNLLGLIDGYAAVDHTLRQIYKLVVVVNSDSHEKIILRAIAAGLQSEELILLDNVDDDALLRLYRESHLFVLPSLHEGFGLPALEAMSCGVPAIGSDTTSVPEVIGRADALFNPRDPQDIARTIEYVLSNSDVRADLQKHALNHAQIFSWDKVAERAVEALEVLVNQHRRPLPVKQAGLPCLAIVTPLPPEKTGIADFCAELIPELSKYYDISVITDQPVVDESVMAWCRVQSLKWFHLHAGEFDRIVYQMGNSPFHQHMPDLLIKFPGIVELHDFFVSAMLRGTESTGYRPNGFSLGMYESHGFSPLELINQNGRMHAELQYPGSRSIIENAHGLIVHSKHAKLLCSKFYGGSSASDWAVIPLLREVPLTHDRNRARTALGIKNDELLVCAFGFIDASKLSRELVSGWKQSGLGKNQKCKLVFVGQNAGEAYGLAMLNDIGDFSEISITGYAVPSVYKNYLQSADFAVQLRTLSRGETSAAVLDCLVHGVPLIVSSNGALAEYPDDVMIKLPDSQEFDMSALTDALQRLATDIELRKTMSKNGLSYVRTFHDPEVIAQQYVTAIENFSSKRSNLVSQHVRKDPAFQKLLNQAAGKFLVDQMNSLRSSVQRCLYVDISAVVRNDLKTGIERVARAVLYELIVSPPSGMRVEPVYLSKDGGHWQYRFARSYYLKLLRMDNIPLKDEIVYPKYGDILYAPDVFWEGVVGASQQNLYTLWRNIGARVCFAVYDILPILEPDFFPPGASDGFEEWLSAVTISADAILCPSHAVAQDVLQWKEQKNLGSPMVKIGFVPLGADIAASVPSKGLPKTADHVLSRLSAATTLLMVGTVEPRKGYLQAIEAMDILWRDGLDINLVIVGAEGWTSLPSEARRTIPEIVEKIKRHPLFNIRLFWLSGISDEYLELVYKASDCLVAASAAEGFGLPLIEAAKHGLPLLVRDIEVFREVTGGRARFFRGTTGEDLAKSIQDFIFRYKKNEHRSSPPGEWLTWEQSAKKIFEFLSEIG